MTTRTCIVATLAVLALALPLQVAGVDGPCIADVEKLCPGVAAGGGRVQACLKQHESQISDACRAKIDVLVQEVKELAVICRFDIGRFCSDVSPGNGQLLSCLNYNASDLSPQCTQALKSFKK